VAQAKRRDDLGSPVIEQLAYADFLERGELDRHLRRTRALYRRRRDALVAALEAHVPAARAHGVAAGLHLMIELPPDTVETALIAAAARRSVAVYGVGVHRARGHASPPALVVGYGAMSERAIAAGVARLAAAHADARVRAGT
jgi:GntR family transcriptional regulator/MocR family aminotransferase